MNVPVRMLLLLLLGIVGCDFVSGEEIARFPINTISSVENPVVVERSLDLKKGEEIAFWSEMDMEYKGTVDLRFRVDVVKDGAEYDQLEINPLEKNITIGEVKTEIMGDTDWSFEGKNGEIEIQEDGAYVFKAWFEASDNPSLNLKQAELILRK